MNGQTLGDVERLQALLGSLEELLKLPESHLRKLSPRLNRSLAAVLLAYLGYRELGTRQQTAGVPTTPAADSNPCQWTH